MFIRNKKLALVCLLSLAFSAPAVVAQTTNSLEEDITFTGESLQGIQAPRIEANYSNESTPKLDVMLKPERQTSGNGDVLFEGLLDSPKNNNSPIYTFDKINTNQGDTTDSQGATMPLVNF
jgi:hypothetical protein